MDAGEVDGDAALLGESGHKLDFRRLEFPGGPGEQAQDTVDLAPDGDRCHQDALDALLPGGFGILDAGVVGGVRNRDGGTGQGGQDAFFGIDGAAIQIGLAQPRSGLQNQFLARRVQQTDGRGIHPGDLGDAGDDQIEFFGDIQRGGDGFGDVEHKPQVFVLPFHGNQASSWDQNTSAAVNPGRFPASAAAKTRRGGRVAALGGSAGYTRKPLACQLFMSIQDVAGYPASVPSWAAAISRGGRHRPLLIRRQGGWLQSRITGRSALS